MILNMTCAATNILRLVLILLSFLVKYDFSGPKIRSYSIMQLQNTLKAVYFKVAQFIQYS